SADAPSGPTPTRSPVRLAVADQSRPARRQSTFCTNALRTLLVDAGAQERNGALMIAACGLALAGRCQTIGAILRARSRKRPEITSSPRCNTDTDPNAGRVASGSPPGRHCRRLYRV